MLGLLFKDAFKNQDHLKSSLGSFFFPTSQASDWLVSLVPRKGGKLNQHVCLSGTRASSSGNSRQ